MPSLPPLPDPEPPLAGLGLEPMRLSDLDEVLAIERASFASPWLREHFRHEMNDNPHALNRVVRLGGRVVAYASLWILFEEMTLNNIAVAPPLRDRGLGAWLLCALLREAVSRGCSRALLDVRVSNAPARALYRRLGFVEVGRRRGYYRPEGEDAIVMVRALV